MNNTNSLPVRLLFAPAKAGFALASLLAVMPAQAFEFELMEGEVTGSLDTTLSYGAMWRVEGRDTHRYGNDTGPTHDDVNTNDGNRNFDTGMVSSVYKINSELKLNYKNYGAFVRGRAFYDTEIMDKDTDWSDTNDRFNRRFPDYFDQAGTNRAADAFDSDVEDLIGKDASIMDAFVFGNFYIGDMPLDVRFGKQVLNWGEGIFYRDSINTINPIDAAQFALPGSELKDVLIPQMALSFNLGITENLSMETYYMMEWDESIVPPVGSYFSNNDIFADGATFGYNKLTNPVTGAKYLEAQKQIYKDNGVNIEGDYLVVADLRGKKNARDSGQWGVNFKFFAEELNETEFGFYFVNYHSQVPFAEAGIRTGSVLDAVGIFPMNPLATLHVMSNGVYANRVYPEDIRMFGLSFNTTVGNTSIAGELTYRPNMPMWIDHPDDLVSGISSNLVTDKLDASSPGIVRDVRNSGSEAGICTSFTNLSQARPNNIGCVGDDYKNFERVELYTGSLVFIHNFGPRFGFDNFIAVLEPSFELVSGIGGNYDAFAAKGSSPYDSRNFSEDYTPSHERLDRFSWGYTTVFSGQWNDVFAGVNLNPILRFKQDVQGNSRVTGNFMEDRKAVTLALNATYMNSLEAGISYTNFFGAERRNKLNDRDNIAFTVKYSF
ncbi:DUF1302 domain-containing protein [Zooshikella ganghwensis]|uniref:DUF1302 domain-containing protein n=1 Tax=Zooshikella ganghwensis TaxID=202772 RepID=A0A4P9VN40_9GAMM|nr:DUF1302 domain-containing protein [Zooshikella ganghwensis]RDH44855.1 DUF1302 domain-containing protein [Zooshikella ganghwensis]